MYGAPWVYDSSLKKAAETQHSCSRMPLVRYVYRSPVAVPVLLPGDRRIVVSATADDSIGDVIRRVCVAENCASDPERPVIVRPEIGGRVVPRTSTLAVAGITTDVPLRLIWPSRAMQPAVSVS